MPCRSYYDPIPPAELAAERDALEKRAEEIAAAQDEITAMVGELDLVTRLLCTTLRILDPQDSEVWRDPEIRAWWAAHKARDQARGER